MLKSFTDSQVEAIKKLKKYKVGALFMEAGTGKTRTAIELVNSTDCDCVLYIAPLGLIKGVRPIEDEINKWGGFKSNVKYVGVESIGASDRIYLECLNWLKGYNKPFIVVDESIKIKNLGSKRTKRVLSLRDYSEYRLILNGTPLTRNYLDLYSQMDFLSPKILDMDICQFEDTFCKITTIEKGWKKKSFISGYCNVDYLYSLIDNFVFQCRLDIDVDEVSNNLYFDVADDIDYYKTKEEFLNSEAMFYMDNNIFLRMTVKMQRSFALDSAKLQKIDELLKTLNGKTIIFCRFVSTRKYCEKKYKDCLVLSLQKSSFGLNLQEYNNIIFFDKVWDYGLIEQAKRRIYRTGQLKVCNYYFVTSNLGLDSLIDYNIDNKISMAEYFKKASLDSLKEKL